MKKYFLWITFILLAAGVLIFGWEQYSRLVAQNDEAKAMKLLESIPELQHIEEVVVKAGQEPLLWPDSEKNGVVTISLHESFKEDAHTNRIETFRVNVRSNEIVVADDVTNKDMSLSEWKKSVVANWP